MRRSMKSIVARRLGVYQEKPTSFRGVIGNQSTGEIDVPGKSSTIYVTSINGVLEEVLNRRVPSEFRRPVRYGYDPSDLPNVLQILSSWDVYSTDETSSIDYNHLAPHRSQHEWPHADTIGVWGEQFLPSCYFPVAGSLSIIIYPGSYFSSTGFTQIRTSTTVDLSSISPALASNECRMVLVVADDSGTITTRTGSIVTGWSNLSSSDIPFPDPGDTAICAVRMFYGQTEIRKNGDNNDFIDLRFTGVSNGPTSVGLTALTGDVTATGPGSAVATISDSSVSLTKMANLPMMTVIGNNEGVARSPKALTIAELVAMGIGSQSLAYDLSSQVTGSTNHFTLTDAVNGIIIVVDGLTQSPNDVTLDPDNLGFTLSFTPEAGNTLLGWANPVSGGSGSNTAVPSALRVYLSNSFR